MTSASSPRNYTIRSEPRGAAFEALLHYCAAVGSHGSLVDLFPESRKGRDARQQFFERLTPHLIGVEAVHQWPGTGPGKATVPLWSFRLESGLLDLLAEAKSLYSFHTPALPDDLAVYRPDGSVLLGSVAHEHIGWMRLTEVEQADARLGLVELRPQRR